MSTELTISSQARRNRIIAITASAITVIAIVFAFASDYLGFGWKWMRPAAELLLLAELVGLIVLERHQLFEPVHDDVAEMKRRLALMDHTLSVLVERVDTSGRVAICATTPEVVRSLERITRAALAREYDGPQVLRASGLSGQLIARDSREGASEVADLMSAVAAYFIFPGSPPGSRGRRWSVRMLFAVAGEETFEAALKLFAPIIDQSVLNLELKLFTQAKIVSMLSPGTITDREAVLVFDDSVAALRWGLLVEDRESVALLARWFDEAWRAVPDSYLVYSRTGFHPEAVDRIRQDPGFASTASKETQLAR